MDAEVPIEPASGRRADPELRSLVETLPDTHWLCDPNPAQAVSTLGYFHPSLSRGLAIVGDAASAWWQRSDPATRTRCFGTLAKAGLHSLLLTPGARVDMRPELEIYADDVQCAHGATSGDLDETALHYPVSYTHLTLPTIYSV